ncbi:FIMAH domain-containing protein [Lentibacillus halodurans]
MESLVESLEEEGEFGNSDDARSLMLHLTSVSHYENQEEAEKVVKHMEEGFQDLLEYQRDNELISERAYNTLIAHTDYLIKKWQ